MAANRVLLFLAVLGLALGALLVWTAPDLADEGPAPFVAMDRPPASEGPRLQGRVLEPEAEPPSAAIDDEPLPSEGLAARVRAPGEGSLQVVVRDPQGDPLEGIRLCADLEHDAGGHALRHVDAHQGGTDVFPRTDFMGRATLFLPADHAGRLSAWSEAPGFEPLELRFQPLSAAQDRSVALTMRHGRDAGLASELRYAKPVPGARIELRRGQETVAWASSDAAGKFQLAWPSWRDAHLRIEADGFSTMALLLSDEQLRRGLVEPRPSASLDVHVTHGAGPVSGALVRLRTRLGDLWDGLERGEPPAELAGELFLSSARTDDQGHARFEDVPTWLRLGLEVAGEPVGHANSSSFSLWGNPERALEWQLGSPATVSGTLIDQDGEPIAGQTLWLVPAPAETWRDVFERDDRGHYLDCEALHLGPQITTSATDGGFLFNGVYAGRYALGPGPACWLPEEKRQTRNERDVAPWAEIVRIDPLRGSPQEIHLRRPRGLYLFGVVVDAEGRRADANVRAWSAGGSAEDAHDGPAPFAIGPLVDAPHRVEARTPRSHSPAVEARPRRRARAGEEQELLELCLKPPEAFGSIAGSVVDAAEGRALEALVRAFPAAELRERLLELDLREPFPEPGVTPDGAWRTDSLGRFRITDLAPGAYVLTARTATSVGWSRTLVPDPGDEVSDVVLRVLDPAELVVERPWSEDPREHAGQLTACVGDLFRMRIPWTEGERLRVPSGAHLALAVETEAGEFFPFDLSDVLPRRLVTLALQSGDATE